VRSTFLSLLLLISSALVFGQSQENTEVAAPQGNTEVVPSSAENKGVERLPEGVILVPGAVASASDASTPLPENGAIVDNAYVNKYFGLSYPFSSDWYQKFQGPPPSDSGYYVLAQLRPSPTFKAPVKGLVLVAAQDLFFSLTPANNAMDLLKYTKEALRPEYKVERVPTEVKIAGHSFVRFDYVAPVADLHWYVLATEIRCHAVEFIFDSRDTKLLDSLMQSLNNLKLPSGGTTAGSAEESPVCIKNYATPANIVSKVDPVLTDRKFNPIPARIIISKTGKVKHIHFISAFPDQAKAISDALWQWQFKPYVQNGQPVEVETGIMFGNARRVPSATANARTPAATN
jgi:hypothetical protein